MPDGREVARAAWRRGWALPPDITVSQWADANRILTRETSQRPGPWRTDFVPFAREIMDNLSPNRPGHFFCLMKGSQIVGTEIVLNAIGCLAETAGGGIMVAQPSDHSAKRFYRRRIVPLLRDTPSLRKLFGKVKARETGGASLRMYPGGSLVTTGMNSPMALSSDPIPYVFPDDLDRAPIDLAEEGSPLDMLISRTTTYTSTRKVFANSTPKIEGSSAIAALYARSDRRRYFVPCPHCGRMDFLTWSGYGNFKDLEDPGHCYFAWDDGKPETVHVVCPACGGCVEEGFKTQMLAGGEWRPTAAEWDGIWIGYHLPSWYAPLGSIAWSDIARQFSTASHEAKRGNREPLKGWVQRIAAEAYREEPTEISRAQILDRREDWPAEVPAGVGAITCAADVQSYGLVCWAWGFGEGEEGWILDTETIEGDPAQLLKSGTELDAFFERTWRGEGGRELRAERKVVDLGGPCPNEVYDYCGARTHRRVYAIRGGNEPNAELLGQFTRKNHARARLYTLGVDNGKGTIASRLKIGSSGTGYIHIPKSIAGRPVAWSNNELAAQLTSEVPIRVRDPKRGWVIRWKKIYENNEAWDCAVYCLAAFRMLGTGVARNLKRRAARTAGEPDPEPQKPDDPPAPRLRVPGPPQPEDPPPSSTTPAPRAPRGWRPSGGYVRRGRF